MNCLDRLIGATCTTAARIGGALLLLSAVMITVDVVLRNTTTVSVGEANELSTYVLIIAGTWAFGFALLMRVHVRIDSLYLWLPHRVCAALDLVSIGSIVAYTGMLLWYAVLVVAKSYEIGARSNTPLRTPLWIPQGLWTIGLVIFLGVATHLLLKSLRAAARGDLREVTRLVGTPGLDEQLQQVHAEVAARGAMKEV